MKVLSKARKVVQVTLDPRMRDAIGAFAESIGEQKISPTLRVLISLGLEKAGNIDASIRYAAYREGIVAGVAAFKSGMMPIVDKLLADYGSTD